MSTTPRQPDVADLIAALPEGLRDDLTQDDALQHLRAVLSEPSERPIPSNQFRRMWTLGTLQGKVAAAYIAWWVRSGLRNDDVRQDALTETHLKVALKLLDGMGYLRGAFLKLGQMLANWPDVVPEEFADILGRLHFEAPPMHFSLLRECVRRELGADPEDLFDDFETRAFAAASLGQVHRAKIKGTDQVVAIKIQYPNIARCIDADIRNFKISMTPMRLMNDWDNICEQVDDIHRMLQLESDYEQEAENLRRARLAFHEGENIVVPRVYSELSSKRVLTMEYLDGLHLGPFMETNPSQETINEHGRQITLASFRLGYKHDLLYADPHPGNYLFLPDGRLGLIDFGCCCRYTPEDVAYLNEMEEAWDSRDSDLLHRAIVKAADLSPSQAQEKERIDLTLAWAAWVWEPLYYEGDFDFGDPAYFKRGLEVWGSLLKKRYVRSLPLNQWLAKNFLGIRAVLARMGAQFSMRDIHLQESTVRS